MADRKKSKEIINVPGMVEYDPPSPDVTKKSIDLKNLRTHRSPNWDGVTGTIFTPKSWDIYTDTLK